MKKRKLIFMAAGICLLFGACGTAGNQMAFTQDAAGAIETQQGQEAKQETEEPQESEDTGRPVRDEEESQPAGYGSENTQNEASLEEAGRGAVISDQSFDVTLAPLGEVRFVSYAPKQESKDAVFTVEKDGAELLALDGMKEGDIRTEDTFGGVEAVSFPDYNGDGFDDIIIICRYLPKDGSGDFSEVRLYEGNSFGTFLLKKELSEETALALADITVESVKGFLGAGKKNSGSVQTGWQQAYIDHIREHQDINDGFALIYLDGDDIPELVEIGDCEASGCRIVVFSDGGLKETQLNRLYFSYIERENLLCNSEGHMDIYYDHVYRIQDGELMLVEKGDYGAPDNSDLQLDENGEPVYEYYWNGEKMSKPGYEQAFHAVYDLSKAKDGYQWNEYDSAETMMQRLRAM